LSPRMKVGQRNVDFIETESKGEGQYKSENYIV